MTERCVSHQFDRAKGHCQHCRHPFCAACLVWPFGETHDPLCIACALTAAGVRRGAQRRPAPRSTRRDRDHGSWRERRRRRHDGDPLEESTPTLDPAPEIAGLPTLGDLVTVAAATDSAEVSASAAPAPVSTPAAVEALPFLTTVAEAPAPPPPPPPPPAVLPRSPLLAPFTTEARAGASRAATPEPAALRQTPAASAVASLGAPPSPPPAVALPAEPMSRLIEELPAAIAFDAPLPEPSLAPAPAGAPTEWSVTPEDISEPQPIEPVTELLLPAPAATEHTGRAEPVESLTEPFQAAPVTQEPAAEQIAAAVAQPFMPAPVTAERISEPQPIESVTEPFLPAPVAPQPAAAPMAAAVSQPERSHQAPPFAPAPPRSFRGSAGRRSAAPAQPPVVIAPWPN